MTFYPRAESDKYLYKRGGLDWKTMIQQCTVKPKPTPSALIVPLTFNKRIAEQQAVHVKNKLLVIEAVNEGTQTVSTLVKKLKLARTAVQEYCKQLIASKQVTFSLGAKQERYFYPTKGVSKC